jgi:hypothetical protein
VDADLGWVFGCLFLLGGGGVCARVGFSREYRKLGIFSRNSFRNYRYYIRSVFGKNLVL